MEVIKDLPEVFEEFAEQRKNSFLGVKQLKDKGVPVLPQRLQVFHAAAAVHAQKALKGESGRRQPGYRKGRDGGGWTGNHRHLQQQ